MICVDPVEHLSFLHLKKRAIAERTKIFYRKSVWMCDVILFTSPDWISA